MTTRSDRLIRVIAFVLGALAGAAIFDFIYSNQGSQNLDWLGVHFSGVPIWSVGVIPLLAGLALGYAYHFPARYHHQREHRRNAQLVERLQRENADIRQQLSVPPPEEPAPPETGSPEAPVRAPKVNATPVANA